MFHSEKPAKGLAQGFAKASKLLQRCRFTSKEPHSWETRPRGLLECTGFPRPLPGPPPGHPGLPPRFRPCAGPRFCASLCPGTRSSLADASAFAPVRHGSAGCWGAQRRGDRDRPRGSSVGGCLTIVRTWKQSLEVPQRCWQPRGGRPNALSHAATLQNPFSTGTRGRQGEQGVGDVLRWHSVSSPAESCSGLALPRGPGVRHLQGPCARSPTCP